MRIHSRSVVLRVAAPILALGLLPTPGLAAPEQDVAALQRQVEAQQKALAAQAETLRRQQEELADMTRALAELGEQLAALKGTPAAPPSPVAGKQPAPAGQAPPGAGVRDAVGDLNAGAVAAGDFPGSIRIPGANRISLAIGGFVKSVVVSDSHLEGAGPIFLPAEIGATVPDEDGNVSVDATLSRLNLDARAPTPGGSLRGYVEWDFNASNRGTPGFNLRHAYGAWTSSHGTLTLGHTWSTLMDLQVLPDGLTEPTLSGAVFQRQAQLRWTQSVSRRWRLDVAIEDPSNRDVISDEPVTTPTRVPDIVGGTQWDWPDRGHVRVTGLFRRLTVEDASANGWALSTGAHLTVLGRDKLAASASYGDGVGRYLLGVPGSFGAFLDPADGRLTLLSGWGGFVTYRHVWSSRARSTVGLGRAAIALVDAAPDDAFRRSVFGLANLMVSPLPYLTYGLEYQYGARREKGGSRRDNQRVIFGVQVF